MARRRFTEQEQNLFRSNPNVAKVSALSIKLTDSCKLEIKRRLDQGEPVNSVMESYGFTQENLGRTRFYGIASHCRGLEDPNTDTTITDEGVFSTSSRGEMKTSECQGIYSELAEIKHQIAYLQEEVEFLKKVVTANMEARKIWESSKRHRTSSSN